VRSRRGHVVLIQSRPLSNGYRLLTRNRIRRIIAGQPGSPFVPFDGSRYDMHDQQKNDQKAECHNSVNEADTHEDARDGRIGEGLTSVQW